MLAPIQTNAPQSSLTRALVLPTLALMLTLGLFLEVDPIPDTVNPLL